MAVKQTKRKAFNFLRSYFDVLNEIPEEGDKLKFLLSIINKQFLNEDPKDLGFLVNLCYESQRHAVEKSVKGWITANKTDLQGNPETPCTPPNGSPYTPPPKEEEEKEQVKEKEEDEVKDFDFDAFYDLDVLSNYYLSKDQIVNTVISLPANKIKDKEHLENRMKDFKQSLIEQGRVKETFKEFAKYFKNWIKVVKSEAPITTKDEYNSFIRKNVRF